ncbi:signal peptide peptidase SppA [Dysgonomonas massiliensis]|uniref:signal peptide peptidase SppA n=1 Tax=Dysgonomonas massiliensis TaxID=2040292 RepID=UPI000C779092|nr:signal peptide peptidase SppA [Dysgonomonas massiliensis]
MKKFLKSVFASIIGCGIVLGIFFFITIVSLVAMSMGSEPKFSLKDNTVFKLELNGVLQDRVIEENPLMELILGESTNQIGLDDVLASIKKAKENDKIKGIYIKVGSFSASTASLKEIRDALKDFKESGKFIISYGDIYMQGAYYLSSVADKVILNNKGMLDLHGLSVQPTFYKGTFDKLGIEMQVFKVGTFKSAVEPYILDKMSDANREQLTAYTGDVWNTILKDISESRNISVEELNNLADQMPLFQTAEFNIEKNLADTLMYETDINKYLMSLLKVEKEKDVRMASLKDMTTVDYVKPSKAEDVIAVLYAEGSITDGSGKDGITDGRFVKELEKLRKDEKVKAVVFRVNSGGGSASASERIWKAVSDLKAEKPVVVSMGDYAASGGYYISCNASKIIAQPNTLTGSIGIFGMFPNFKGLLTDKVGLTFDVVKTNEFADFGNGMRAMNDKEKALLQAYINQGYDLFLTRCADGRQVAKDSIAQIAEGRVWTGNQALEIGLVDAIGGIDTAIAEAAKLAELKDYKLANYPAKVDFFESLLMDKKESVSTRIMKEYLGDDYATFSQIKEIKDQKFNVIQARIPYTIAID